MKSIYSLEVLQSILDHWGIGKISDVTYFENVGRQIWRHFIETNQGRFELYSYVPEEDTYAQQKLAEFWKNMYGQTDAQRFHSFDRYHILRRLSVKHRITPKQIAGDLALLQKTFIKDIYRVYGSIMQMEFSNGMTLFTYAAWNMERKEKGKKEASILVDSFSSKREKMDAVLKEVEIEKPVFKKYLLKGNWFELFFQHGLSFHFHSWDKFAAAEILFPERKKSIHIFSEEEIYYFRDLEPV